MWTKIYGFLFHDEFETYVQEQMKSGRIASEADFRWRVADYLEKKVLNDPAINNWFVHTEMLWKVPGVMDVEQRKPDIVAHHKNKVKAAIELKVFRTNIGNNTTHREAARRDLDKLVRLHQCGAEQAFFIYLYVAGTDPFRVPDRHRQHPNVHVIGIAIPKSVMLQYRSTPSFAQA